MTTFESTSSEEAPEPSATAEPEASAEQETTPDAPGAPDPAPEVVPEAQQAPAAPPQEILPPKERRRRARSTGQASRPPRSAQERQSERLELRSDKRRRRQATRARARNRASTAPAVAAPAPELEPRGAGRPKVRQGVVVSDKADKTITVRIDIARRHRRYQKIVRSSRTLHAHDERNEAHEGDTVRVVESRPTSRTKRWRLVDVLDRAR